MPDFSLEHDFHRQGLTPICGIDEVGRGPLAGPVVAAAVILPPAIQLPGLNDSKKLSAKKRDVLDALIREQALAYSIGSASVEEIDAINILQATLLAMRRAVADLPFRPAAILVDGMNDPQIGLPTHCVKKGDSRSLSIAAASVVAKVFRDRLMQKLDLDYPGYGWATNAGYGSVVHMQAIEVVGITPHHRKTFRPIAEVLDRKSDTSA